MTLPPFQTLLALPLPDRIAVATLLSGAAVVALAPAPPELRSPDGRTGVAVAIADGHLTPASVNSNRARFACGA